MPYIAGGIFLMAFIMSYLYPKGVESGNKMMEGLKFGAIMGVFWITPYQMVMYGSVELFTRKAVLVDAVLHLIIGAVGGIVIAYCYGDKPKE